MFMKSTQTKLFLAVSAIAVLVTAALAQSPSRAALGKIDFQALLDAAPALPATTAEAGNRTYGADVKSADQGALNSFYAPFEQRVAAARAAIQGAVANRGADDAAVADRAVAQANASPIISRMGGIEKMGQMSEQELQQAAAQAAGGYVQSMAGAPPGAGAGIQAMMQRMMNDPAYQARFEKMSKAEQEAEMRKMMGNTMAPAPPSGPTAAERQAKQATTETASVVARQQELGAIFQRLSEIDAEFAKRNGAIAAAPGGHNQIREDVNAKLARVPMIKGGEAGDIREPIQEQSVIREHATRDRERATAELQQQAALFNQRKARYKEVATAYSNWLRGSGGVNTQTAQLLDDASVQIAVRMEEQLIQVSESLGKYSSGATSNAAQYEQAYQVRMSEPLVKSASSAKGAAAGKSDDANKGDDASKRPPSKRESIFKRLPSIK